MTKIRDDFVEQIRNVPVVVTYTTKFLSKNIDEARPGRDNSIQGVLWPESSLTSFRLHYHFKLNAGAVFCFLYPKVTDIH